MAIVSELSMVQGPLATVMTEGDSQSILVREFEIMLCSSQLFFHKMKGSKREVFFANK